MSRLASIANRRRQSVSTLTERTVVRNRKKKNTKIIRQSLDSTIRSMRDNTPTIDAMRKSMAAELNHYRDDSHLHASDLIYRCTRALAIHKKFNIPIPAERLEDTRALTFAVGRAIGDFVIDRMRSTIPDELYGRWECHCGETMEETTLAIARDMKCSACYQKPVKYHEMVIMDDEWGLSGSIDLTRKINGSFYLTELKSISSKRFDDLVRPVPEHIIQILLYWHLANRAGWPLYDKVSILYVRKDFSFKQIYKEYKLEPAKMMDVVQPYIDDAINYKHALDTNVLPERKLCTSASSKMAKECEVCNECFQVDPPVSRSRSQS